eukprot:c19146_g1_i3.p1 GENE.c19146_g1_i3~~c19146_g1_i3.p1  ORF type:complete len:1504 (+),score=359.48 c19146_g1_i3:307-4512(+)
MDVASDNNATILSHVVIITLHSSSSSLLVGATVFTVTQQSDGLGDISVGGGVTWFNTAPLPLVSTAELQLWKSQVAVAPNQQYFTVIVGPHLIIWTRSASPSTSFEFAVPPTVSCAPLMLDSDLAFAPVTSWVSLAISSDSKYIAIGSASEFALSGESASACDVSEPVQPGRKSFQGELSLSVGLGQQQVHDLTQQILLSIVQNDPEFSVTFDHVANTLALFTASLPTAKGAVITALASKWAIASNVTAVAADVTLNQILPQFTVTIAPGNHVVVRACVSLPLPSGLNGTYLQAITGALTGPLNIVSSSATQSDTPTTACFTADFVVSASIAQFRQKVIDASRTIVQSLATAIFNTLIVITPSTNPHKVDWNVTNLGGNFLTIYDADRLRTNKDCNINNDATSAVIAAKYSCFDPISSLQFAPQVIDNRAAVVFSFSDNVPSGLTFLTNATTFLGPATLTPLRNSISNCDICDLAALTTQTAPPECRDDPRYRDPAGHACSFWASLSCSDAGTLFNFQAATVADLLGRCPLSCRVCFPTNSTTPTGLTGACAAVTDFTCEACLAVMTTEAGSCASDSCLRTAIPGSSLTFSEACVLKCQTEADSAESCLNFKPSDAITCGTIGLIHAQTCAFSFDLATVLDLLDIVAAGTFFAWRSDAFVANVNFGGRQAFVTSTDSVATIVSAIRTGSAIATQTSTLQSAVMDGLQDRPGRDLLYMFNKTAVVLLEFQSLNPIRVVAATPPFAFGKDPAGIVWSVSPITNSTSQITATRSIFSNSDSTFSFHLAFSRPTTILANDLVFTPTGTVAIESVSTSIFGYEVKVVANVLAQGRSELSLPGIDSVAELADFLFIADRVPPIPVVIALNTTRVESPNCSVVTSSSIIDLLIQYPEPIVPQCFQQLYGDKLAITASDSNSRLLVQLNTTFSDSNIPGFTCDGGLSCDANRHRQSCGLVLAASCPLCSVSIVPVTGSVLDFSLNANPAADAFVICIDRVAPVVSATAFEVNGDAANLTSAPRKTVLHLSFDEAVFGFTVDALICNVGCFLDLSSFKTITENFEFSVRITVTDQAVLIVTPGATDLAGNSNDVAQIILTPRQFVKLLSEETIEAIFTATTFLLLCTFAVSFLNLKFRAEKELHQMTPLFSQLILLGIALTGFSNYAFGSGMFVSSSNARSNLCHAAFYFQILGITLFLGSLVTRNYRVWRVFDNPSLRSVKVTVKDLVVIELFLVLVIAILLAAFSAKGGASSQVASATKAQSFYVCKVEGAEPMYALVAFLLLVYVFGAYITCRIVVLGREGGFNESKAIAFAFYNIVFVVVVFFVVSSTLNNADAYFGLLSFSQLWFMACSLVVLFAPPLYRFHVRRRKETWLTGNTKRFDSTTQGGGYLTSELTSPSVTHSKTSGK